MEIKINHLLAICLLMLGALSVGCSKADPDIIDEEEDEVETKTTSAAFYFDQPHDDEGHGDYWISSLKVGHASTELGSFTVHNTQPQCNKKEWSLITGRYELTEADFQTGKIVIQAEYNYYPTSIFMRQLTFEIPTHVFKEGTCTPVQFLERTPGILQLYAHEQGVPER